MPDTPFQMEVEELKRRLDSGEDLALLDVREPWETALCVIPGSALIPMNQIPARIEDLPADRPLVVVCHHGFRSGQVAAWLRGNGITRAINLSGGIDAWAKRIDPKMATY